MTTQIQERLEVFSFTDQEPVGLSSWDATPNQTNNGWVDLWQFQLPPGYTYIYDRSSIFSLYLSKLAADCTMVQTDDGGTLVNDTIDANDAGADDVQPFPATQAENDAFYIGYEYRFNQLTVTIGTAGTDLAWDEQWEYYTGSAWAAVPGGSATLLSVWTDTAGAISLSYTMPTDWARTVVGGVNLFWLRCRLNSTITTQATVDPLITKIQIHATPPELQTSDQVRIVWTDPNMDEQRRLMGAVQYARLREFQQQSKLHHLDIGNRIVVPEHYLIKIQAKLTTPVDISASYFNLVGARTRQAIL
jgi:hypothetical protein